MVVVAAAEAVALIVVVVVFARIVSQQTRAHARREDLLTNQLLHAAGLTWQEPPAVATREARNLRSSVPEPELQASPEQHDPVL